MFDYSSNLLYNLGESISNNKKILLKSDSKVYEKKENKNTNEDPPMILKYIKNQVNHFIQMRVFFNKKLKIIFNKYRCMIYFIVQWLC